MSVYIEAAQSARKLAKDWRREADDFDGRWKEESLRECKKAFRRAHELIQRERINREVEIRWGTA